MRLICTIEEALRDLPLPKASDQVAAIIPAAGRSSRLGFELPKILFPLAGTPIIDWQADVLQLVCQSMVFVLSPDGIAHVNRHLSRRHDLAALCCIQSTPCGMADAILCAERHISTKDVFVIWGDTVGLSRRLLDAMLRLHLSNPAIVLTLATVNQKNPYIHFTRDHNERIVQVYERRESDMRLPIGESDCGVFLFRASRLFSVLHDSRKKGLGMGASTGEFSLLPLIPLFHDGDNVIATLRLDACEAPLGVNSPEDANAAERRLSRAKEGAHE